MITEELGNMETEMNVEQEVLKEQGHELNAAKTPDKVLRKTGHSNAIPNGEAEGTGEKGKDAVTEALRTPVEKSEAREERSTNRGEVSMPDLKEPTLSSRVPVTLPMPMAGDAEDRVEVVISDIPLSATPKSSSVAVSPSQAENSPSAPDSPDSSDIPSVSNAPVSNDAPAIISPGKKRSKKGRHWKKSGRKDKLEELQVEALPSSGAESQASPEETQRDSLDRDNPDLTQHRASQDQSPSSPAKTQLVDMPQSSPTKVELSKTQLVGTSQSSPTTVGLSKTQLVDTSQSSPTKVGLAEPPIAKEEKPETVAASPVLTMSRSLGRWADIIEEGENSRAIESEPERSQVGRSQVDNSTANRLSSQKEEELRGKGQQSSEVASPPSRELRGKGQQSSEAASPASRESNWRRKPAESMGRSDGPYSPGRSAFDRDTRKDEQQDFRPRMQHGAEPQATHKNWIPRRGFNSRSEGDGRTEQNKMRGKAKQQGRQDSGVQVQSPTSKDFARQKFDADLKIKQDELLQKSKLSLKAEFLKTKRMEQARKGRDDLEAELNKNLVYEEGELFFLNMNP